MVKKIPVQIVHNDIYTRTSDLSAPGKLDTYISTEKVWQLAVKRASSAN